MSATGDFAKMAKLSVAFASLRSKQAQITKRCASTSVKLNQASFAGRTSPDGDGWVGGAYYRGLRGRTGKLAGSFRAISTATTFGVKNVARYAFYHQNGAVLRAAIAGSTGRLRTIRRGAGRGRSGPAQRVRQQGPKRKGAERGFLPARPIVARGDIPTAWRQSLDRAVLSYYKAALQV